MFEENKSELFKRLLLRLCSVFICSTDHQQQQQLHVCSEAAELFTPAAITEKKTPGKKERA